jgi:hypothetical protein
VDRDCKTRSGMEWGGDAKGRVQAKYGIQSTYFIIATPLRPIQAMVACSSPYEWLQSVSLGSQESQQKKGTFPGQTTSILVTDCLSKRLPPAAADWVSARLPFVDNSVVLLAACNSCWGQWLQRPGRTGGCRACFYLNSTLVYI